MADDAARQDDTIRKTRMMLHMLITLFPTAEKEERMLALAKALSIFQDLHPEEASKFLIDNYDAVYRTKGVRDDFARLMGYESADDPQRIKDALELREEIDHKYGNQENQPADTVETVTTPHHSEQQASRMDHFQEGNYALEPGSYALAIRASNPIINPGDAVELEVYITGYGRITGPKVSSTLPPNFVDTKRSSVSHSFKRPPDGEATSLATVEFGGREDPISSVGFVSQLAGVSGYIAEDGTDVDWGEHTLFWDANYPGEGRTPTIASEMHRGKAPLEVNLQTTKQIPPGNHSFQFHLTYFNGEQWQTTSQSVTLVVRNWFQRNQALTWSLGALGILFTVLSLSMNVVVNWDAVRGIIEAVWGG